MSTPFSDLLDQVMPAGIEIPTKEGPDQQGNQYFNRPSEFGRNYWTIAFRDRKDDPENPDTIRYEFEVQRWQAAGGDRWRTREVLLSSPGRPYLSKDLAPAPRWHRWHDANRKHLLGVVDQRSRVLRPLLWALWWLSDQLWTFGEDHSGWEWTGIEAVQAKHEQLWFSSRRTAE